MLPDASGRRDLGGVGGDRAERVELRLKLLFLRHPPYVAKIVSFFFVSFFKGSFNNRQTSFFVRYRGERGRDHKRMKASKGRVSDRFLPFRRGQKEITHDFMVRWAPFIFIRKNAAFRPKCTLRPTNRDEFRRGGALGCVPFGSPGGSVRGERVNFTGLVLGCIEAKVCK